MLRFTERIESAVWDYGVYSREAGAMTSFGPDGIRDEPRISSSTFPCWKGRTVVSDNGMSRFECTWLEGAPVPVDARSRVGPDSVAPRARRISSPLRSFRTDRLDRPLSTSEPAGGAIAETAAEREILVHHRSLQSDRK